MATISKGIYYVTETEYIAFISRYKKILNKKSIHYIPKVKKPKVKKVPLVEIKEVTKRVNVSKVNKDTNCVDLYATDYFITIDKYIYNLFEQKKYPNLIYTTEECNLCRKNFDTVETRNIKNYNFLKEILNLLKKTIISVIADIIFNYLVIFSDWRTCIMCSYNELINNNIVFCNGSYHHHENEINIVTNRSSPHALYYNFKSCTQNYIKCKYYSESNYLEQHLTKCNFHILIEYDKYKDIQRICEDKGILVKQKNNTYLLYKKIIIDDTNINDILYFSGVVHIIKNILDANNTYRCETCQNYCPSLSITDTKLVAKGHQLGGLKSNNYGNMKLKNKKLSLLTNNIDISEFLLTYIKKEKRIKLKEDKKELKYKISKHQNKIIYKNYSIRKR